MPMDPDELRHQIGTQNEIRRLFQRIMRLFQNGTAPVDGKDLLSVYESKSFFVDPSKYFDRLEKLVVEMEHLKAEEGFVPSNGAPRILLTGTPAGRGSDKVLKLIEGSGGAVVCLENCSGIKSAYFMVDEDEKDPLMAIARGYLRLPCSCMAPNMGRFDLIGRLIEDLNIQGVVNLTWQFCHTYNVEAYRVRELVESKYGLPILHVETDYSESDTGQLKTRIEAFLEMMK
jgi:benzoyl-CoA reductase/2-hydroxyglutaryl-CoA dehydratase subunit BcrC/BadD/HgdB